MNTKYTCTYIITYTEAGFHFKIDRKVAGEGKSLGSLHWFSLTTDVYSARVRKCAQCYFAYNAAPPPLDP